MSSQTEGNFSVILDLLKDIHLSQQTPYDCRCLYSQIQTFLERFTFSNQLLRIRCLALKWTLDIIEALNNSQNLYFSAEFCNLIESVVALGITESS